MLADRGAFPRFFSVWNYSHKYGKLAGVRTTIDIPDSLYRELKGKAASEGRSVKELILRGVEVELKGAPARRSRRITLPLIRSKRSEKVDLDNAKIFEIIPFP